MQAVAASSEATITPGQKRLVVGTAAFGMFAGMLAGLPLTITVPTIADAFAVEVPTAQWVMTAYFIAQAATMLPVGSAGDILGRGRVFTAGFVILIIGLGLTPLVSNINTLIVLRVLHGVGAGMIMVTAPAITTSILPPTQRGRAVALVILGSWIGSGVGQPIFGTVAQFLPWQAIFMVIIVPAAVGLVLSLKVKGMLPERSSRSFDFLGAWLMLLAFGALVVAVGHGQQEHWELEHTASHVGPLFLVSIVATALYLLHARRSPTPIIPLHLFKDRTLATATITNVLLHMTMLIISFIMPFYLQNVLGYPPAMMALMLVPMAIALNVMAFPSGWAYDRLGSKIPCTLAMVLGTALLLSFTQLTATSSLFEVMTRLVIAGFVLGLFVSPNISAILGAVPREHYGLMSGFEQTTRNMGHAMGVVLSSAVVTFYLPEGTQATADIYVSVVQGAGLLAGGMLAIGSVLALLRRDSRVSRRGRVQPQAEPQVQAQETGTG